MRTIGLTGLALLIIFIVGFFVVLGFLLHITIMLLPAIIIILLVYFLFRSLNKMKRR